MVSSEEIDECVKGEKVAKGAKEVIKKSIDNISRGILNAPNGRVAPGNTWPKEQSESCKTSPEGLILTSIARPDKGIHIFKNIEAILHLDAVHSLCGEGQRAHRLGAEYLHERITRSPGLELLRAPRDGEAGGIIKILHFQGSYVVKWVAQIPLST
jgi:hypothetical protein